MRIVLDDRALKFSGMGVYTHNIYTAIKHLENEAFLYNDNLSVSRSSFIEKYINFLRRQLNDQFMLVNFLDINKADLYHATRNTGVPFFSPVPVVVTIHDIIPHVFSQQYLNNILEKIYYEIAIRISIHRSAKILTISNFSKQELIKHYNVTPNKIEVIPLACNDAFRKITDSKHLQSIREKYSLNDNYILAIGGSEYRKNIERLIHVYNKNFTEKYKLIVIGGKWRDIDLRAQYASEKIKFLTNIPEEDLIAIYNMAEVFVFPSFYEGFGIPVLEGMACGVPVVTSKVSSMPEVGGDAAVYFDPFDEKDMAEKIATVLDDSKLREQLIAKGFEQCKKFSWEKCCRATLEVYRDVVGRR